MTFPAGWEEFAFIEVQKFDASTPLKWQFAAITDSIDISEGDVPGEGIPNIAGGRIWKQGPQEDGEITIEMYPIRAEAADDDANYGLFQQWVGGTIDTNPVATDTSWAASVSRERDRFAVSILWTNDASTAATASGATAASTDSLRFAALGCRMISHKTVFNPTDPLKTTVTFKYPAFNKEGTIKMSRWESASSNALAALFTSGDYNDEDSWT